MPCPKIGYVERKDLVKSTILELFRTAKDVIPRDYSQAELIQELLHEMIFLNVFQGDESKLRRISDFLRVPAHSERLFALYQMTLRGNLPTPADADFLDSDSILDATEPVTVGLRTTVWPAISSLSALPS